MTEYWSGSPLLTDNWLWYSFVTYRGTLGWLLRQPQIISDCRMQICMGISTRKKPLPTQHHKELQGTFKLVLTLLFNVWWVKDYPVPVRWSNKCLTQTADVVKHVMRTVESLVSSIEQELSLSGAQCCTALYQQLMFNIALGFNNGATFHRLGLGTKKEADNNRKCPFLPLQKPRKKSNRKLLRDVQL